MQQRQTSLCSGFYIGTKKVIVRSTGDYTNKIYLGACGSATPMELLYIILNFMINLFCQRYRTNRGESGKSQ